MTAEQDDNHARGLPSRMDAEQKDSQAGGLMSWSTTKQAEHRYSKGLTCMRTDMQED